MSQKSFCKKGLRESRSYKARIVAVAVVLNVRTSIPWIPAKVVVFFPGISCEVLPDEPKIVETLAVTGRAEDGIMLGRL
jgi:hypothetical protein